MESPNNAFGHSAIILLFSSISHCEVNTVIIRLFHADCLHCAQALDSWWDWGKMTVWGGRSKHGPWSERGLGVLSLGRTSVLKRDERWVSGCLFGSRLCLQCPSSAVRSTNIKAPCIHHATYVINNLMKDALAHMHQQYGKLM